MPAPSKRRHRSYYLSLPIVIAVVFLLVARLVAVQRAEIIEELSDRVAHHDPEDASAAVRQLSEMPRPPVAVLVAAASSADRKVAHEAKQAIGRLLRRAQQQLEAGRGAKTAARQLTDLARELADDRHAFPAADQVWLVSTTQRILRLANQVPPKHAPIVAANCDLILTSIPAVGPATAEPPMTPEPIPVSSPVVEGEPGNAESNDSFTAPWREDRSQPMFRTLPTTRSGQPIDPRKSPRSFSTPPELPPDIEMLGRPLADVGTRDVLRKWRDTGSDSLTSSEKELLNQCGFDRLSGQLVQKLFSSPQERIQLAEDVLQQPGINARPWLLLLASDPDAEVRLAAVTIMATSTDAALVEQAWQAAIHDRDPRVAALANRLRERRAATQRR